MYFAAGWILLSQREADQINLTIRLAERRSTIECTFLYKRLRETRPGGQRQPEAGITRPLRDSLSFGARARRPQD